jgi:hypothetical protein
VGCFIDLANISIDAAVAPKLDLWTMTLSRLLASFVGAFGFAILLNGSLRNVVCVGRLAILGNRLRLALAREYGLAVSRFLSEPASFRRPNR